MARALTSHSLEVPGACLHYETRGTGPVLALIGLPMTGIGFEALATRLETDYTVVTYDPRGFGRSVIEDPEQDSTPELTAEDVHRVLADVTDEPALVFGSSGGAVTGLALLSAYPDQVRMLVAHEPPVFEMLPDADKLRVQTRDVYDTYVAEGAEAAFTKFMTPAGFTAPEPDHASSPPVPPAPTVEADAGAARAQADGERMLAHSLLPTGGYRPDIEALRAAPTRVVIAGGVASAGQTARRAGDALAVALGTPLVEFPGDHGGFGEPVMGFSGEPDAFAVRLRDVLAEAP